MYNDNYRNSGTGAYEEDVDTIQGLNSFISKVFGWMFMGLLLTAVVAYFVSTNVSLMSAIFSNNLLFWGLFVVEIVLVGFLSARVHKLRFGTALALFLAYAAINGITFSLFFYVYTSASLVSAFVITALTFGAMSLYGYFTKADLSQFKNILFMGLIGLFILSIVNTFLANSTLDWIASIVGLFVFLGLTAYDLQKLKAYYYGTDGDVAFRDKLAIIGALSLYLDFINLLIIILRFFGRRRD